MQHFLLGSLASLISGTATSIGAIPAFFTKKINEKFTDSLLGFSAGVMLASASFSLIVPALRLANNNVTTIITVCIGILFGGFFLDYVDKHAPHFHTLMGYEGGSSKMNKIILFIIAITIHNFPEGLAVGVSFSGGNFKDGLSIALGIGLQNIPEGIAVAFPLVSEGVSKTRAFFITLLTGVVETIGGIIGAGIVQVSKFILPFMLAFAAGAMLFVISDEIIPETHRGQYYRTATYGIMLGFVVMLLFDALL
jgi:Predicted divalent heavy-metal cations transporter